MTLLLAALLAAASQPTSTPAVGTLAGVWKVAEIVHPQGEKNLSPQPTVYIFTAQHYSHVSVTSFLRHSGDVRGAGGRVHSPTDRG